MRFTSFIFVVTAFYLTLNCSAQQGAQMDFLFPFFVQGTISRTFESRLNWETEFNVSNPNSQELGVVLEAFSASGESLRRMTDSIPALGSKKMAPIFADDQVRVGWIRVTLSRPGFVQGSLALVNVVNIGTIPLPPEAHIQAVTALKPGVGLKEGRIFVERKPRQSTGIAIAFPKEQATAQTKAEGEFRLVDERGTEIGKHSVSVPVNGQIIFLVEDVFPQLREREFVGTVEIQFKTIDTPVFAQAIFFQSNPSQFREALIGKIR